MGAVPGFCTANHHNFIDRKLLGTAPDNLGDSPEFTATVLLPQLRCDDRHKLAMSQGFQTIYPL